MWFGPYIIDEKLGNFSYALRMLNGQRLKYPVNIAKLKRFVHRQFRPTGTPEKSGIEVSPEANIAPNDKNNAEDNGENTDEILDDESNHTEAQNANEPQSPKDGEKNR